jgi:hypothetical protein
VWFRHASDLCPVARALDARLTCYVNSQLLNLVKQPSAISWRMICKRCELRFEFSNSGNVETRRLIGFSLWRKSESLWNSFGLQNAICKRYELRFEISNSKILETRRFSSSESSSGRVPGGALVVARLHSWTVCEF